MKITKVCMISFLLTTPLGLTPALATTVPSPSSHVEGLRVEQALAATRAACLAWRKADLANSTDFSSRIGEECSPIDAPYAGVMGGLVLGFLGTIIALFFFAGIFSALRALACWRPSRQSSTRQS